MYRQISNISCNKSHVWNASHQGWGAVSDLSLISDLSQKFKHDLWRVKSKLKLSQKQHLTPGLAVVSAKSIEAKCLIMNEDVVGAAPIGDAPTTSEWSKILLPVKVRLI